MSIRSNAIFSFVTLMVAPSVLAQDVPPLQKMLLPVVATERPGAHGSVWRHELSISNPTEDEIIVDGIDPHCGIAPCAYPAVPPGSTIFPQLVGPFGSIPAVFLNVEESRIRDLAVQLRIRDLSRHTTTWGTEVPTILENDAFTSTFQLLDVPLGERFRVLLRVYDFAATGTADVRLRFFAIDPEQRVPRSATSDVLLHETLIRTTAIPTREKTAPGYAQLLLDAVPELAGEHRLRISIEPVDPQRGFWAMASVTNNETQHVTLVTPGTAAAENEECP